MSLYFGCPGRTIFVLDLGLLHYAHDVHTYTSTQSVYLVVCFFLSLGVGDGNYDDSEGTYIYTVSSPVEPVNVIHWYCYVVTLK